MHARASHARTAVYIIRFVRLPAVVPPRVRGSLGVGTGHRMRARCMRAWPSAFSSVLPILAALLVMAAIPTGADAPAAKRRQQPWQPAPSPLMTRRAKDVRPDQTPEHPRSMRVRPPSSWRHLNGLWQIDINATDLGAPPFGAALPSEILVPYVYPVESPLSGIRQLPAHYTMWYRRTFGTSAAPLSGAMLLHFEAVDQNATVFLNGRRLGACSRRLLSPADLDPPHPECAAGKCHAQGSAKNAADLAEHFVGFSRSIAELRDEQRLSTSVYPQLTDCETECNGLLTYGHRLKLDAAGVEAVRAANDALTQPAEGVQPHRVVRTGVRAMASQSGLRKSWKTDDMRPTVRPQPTAGQPNIVTSSTAIPESANWPKLMSDDASIALDLTTRLEMSAQGTPRMPHLSLNGEGWRLTLDAADPATMRIAAGGGKVGVNVKVIHMPLSIFHY